MATPSGVGDTIWFSEGFRAQSWGFGSAKHGDSMSGTWEVYAGSQEAYRSLYSDVPGRAIATLRRAFADNGQTFLTPHRRNIR